MGRRGPPKTPTEVLKQRGSWLAPQREKEGEPKPDAAPDGESFEPTHKLGEIALAEWNRIIPELRHMKILHSCDKSAIVNYCEAWENYCLAYDNVKKHGIVFQTKSGDQVISQEANPAVAIMDKSSMRCLKFIQQLGLSPASRPNIKGGEGARGSSTDRKAAAKRNYFASGGAA